MRANPHKDIEWARSQGARVVKLDSEGICEIEFWQPLPVLGTTIDVAAELAAPLTDEEILNYGMPADLVDGDDPDRVKK